MAAEGRPDRQRSPDPGERRKQLRSRNLALLAALLAFVVLIYIVAIVRMGGS
jgi:hypothetical protein